MAVFHLGAECNCCGTHRENPVSSCVYMNYYGLLLQNVFSSSKYFAMQLFPFGFPELCCHRFLCIMPIVQDMYCQLLKVQPFVGHVCVFDTLVICPGMLCLPALTHTHCQYCPCLYHKDHFMTALDCIVFVFWNYFEISHSLVGSVLCSLDQSFCQIIVMILIQHVAKLL